MNRTLLSGLPTYELMRSYEKLSVNESKLALRTRNM